MFFGLLLVKCKSTDMGIMHSVNLRIRLRGCATAESQTKPQVSSILTAQKITYNVFAVAVSCKFEKQNLINKQKLTMKHGGKRENSGRKEKFTGGSKNRTFTLPLEQPYRKEAILKIKAILNEVANKIKKDFKRDLNEI